MSFPGPKLNRAQAGRAFTNNLRTNITTNFTRRRQINLNNNVTQSLPKVEHVELYLEQNAEKHRTHRYVLSNESLIVRRGQKFYIAVRFNRDYEEHNTIKIIFSFGPQPIATKGTKNVLLCQNMGRGAQSRPGQWDAVISSINGSDVVLEIESPATCQIGIWACSVLTGTVEDPTLFEEKKIEEDIYMLLNPWNEADLVYMPDEDERNEYVMNDVGKLWMGSYRQPKGRKWVFGQFEDAALPCSVFLLEMSDLPHEDRGNPVLLARAISAVINADDDDGLIIGRWDGNYRDGTAPLAWTGSLPIMEQYLQTGGTPVAYGQCWVFSALIVTVCRALGLPCRPDTNYISAHDTNSSLTVDKYFTNQGDEIQGGPDGNCNDSCWNFHVWNVVWMSRPELPAGLGGWQVIDGTPQEMSGNMYRCGPASVEAVKNGLVGHVHDTAFVFAEVNADLCHFKEDHKSHWGFSRTSLHTYHVGRMIITKKVGVDDDAGDTDLWDVTSLYKKPEGSREERNAVLNAVRGVQNASLTYNLPEESTNDVTFDLLEIDQIHFGQPFNVVVRINNTSNEIRHVNGSLSANSVFYTGAKHDNVKKTEFNIRMTPNSERILMLTVGSEEYEKKMVDHSIIKIYAMATVLETNLSWSDEDDFPLIKPSLDIKISGNVVIGEPCVARFSFSNPLRERLTNCTISLEGPGLQFPKILKLNDVEPLEIFTYSESFHPRRAGNSKFVGSFNSTELTDVSGSVGVFVK